MGLQEIAVPLQFFSDDAVDENTSPKFPPYPGEIMDKPYIVEPAVEFKDGAVHANIIEDAVTRTEYYMKVSGPVYALQMIKPLKEMSKNGGYRAPLAKQMLHKVYRQAFVTIVRDMLSI